MYTTIAEKTGIVSSIAGITGCLREKKLSQMNVCCQNGSVLLFVLSSVLGKVRSAVGCAQLLMSQKFQQFRGLCEQNLVCIWPFCNASTLQVCTNMKLRPTFFEGPTKTNVIFLLFYLLHDMLASIHVKAFTQMKTD